jgi:hypothetical protein
MNDLNLGLGAIADNVARQDRRTMTDIITAARTHPIIARLGLRADLFDLAA